MFSSGHSGSGSGTAAASSAAAASATVTIAAPPTPTTAIAKACTTVIAGLPVQLAGLNARKYDSNSSFVAAWGQPAVVLRCGVKRVPEATLNNVDKNFIRGVNYDSDPAHLVNWLLSSSKSSATYTTIDRGATVVEVTVPQGQLPASVLPDISKAVAQLPATCGTADDSGTLPAHLSTCDGTN